MTAIRQIELSEPISDICGLHPYTRCMIVFRWHGDPVGREFVPVIDGRVAAATLERFRAGAPGREALSRWLDETLGHNPRTVLGGPASGATVAICTRERPADLERALQAVAALDPVPDEVLVVDNAPTTDASERVARSHPRVRYVREPRCGLNTARNRALQEATEDIVAFTDDDAVPERGWLAALSRNFGDPSVACVTGMALPLELETEPQELFEGHCSFVRGFYRRVYDMSCIDPLEVGSIGAGANMAVRRRAVLDLGGFDGRLDAGTPTRSGGDHEMFVRILADGHQIVYDPTAVSWHRHRRSQQELVDTVFGYGVGVYAMWTGLLLERREWGVFKRAGAWLLKSQLPTALGFHGRGRGAAKLARAELRGCLRGPGAWLAARRMAARGA